MVKFDPPRTKTMLKYTYVTYLGGKFIYIDHLMTEYILTPKLSCYIWEREFRYVEIPCILSVIKELQ